MKPHFYPLFLSCCIICSATHSQAQIISPTPNQAVDSLVPLIVQAQASYPITTTSVVASVAGRSWTMHPNVDNYNRPDFTDSISLGGLPLDSTYTLTVVAKYSNGDSTVMSENILLDPKPVVTILSPADWTVSRHDLNIKARCAATAGHCQLTVVIPTPFGPPNRPITLGPFIDSCATTVDVSAYEGLGSLQFNVTGTDEHNVAAITGVQGYFVETSPYLTPVFTAAPNKRIYDLLGNNVLIYDIYGHPDTPKIINFITGAQTSIPFYRGLPYSNGAFLSDQGAVFQGGNNLYDWNNGTLDSVGGGALSLHVSGSYAGWNTGSTQYYRNLATKTTVNLGPNISNNFSISPTGGLPYTKMLFGDSLFLYQGGTSQLIATSAGTLGPARTDGRNVVYTRVERPNNNYILERYDANTHTENFLANLANTFYYNSALPPYLVNNGYTAYLSFDGNNVLQAWIRDTTGVSTQVTSFPQNETTIENLTPNGQLAFNNSSVNNYGERFIYDKTAGLTAIGSVAGTSYYQNSKWYVVLGNTVFQANLSVTPDKADSSSIHVLEDSAYKFAASDFAAHYETSGSLVNVTIVKLPVHGSLKLNGTNVFGSQVIPTASLSQLVYTTVINYTGTDTILWTGSNGFTASPARVPLVIHVDSVLPALPPVPQISGLAANYCSLQSTVVNFTVTNMPIAGTGTTVTATLDGAPLTVAANGGMTMSPWLTAAGYHNVVVVFTNSVGSDTGRASFQLVQASTVKVSVAASPATLTSQSQSSVLTATNVSGGGSAPLFTFAWDRYFNNTFQGPGTSNTTTISGSTLVQGSNRIYVKMQTSDSCSTNVIDVDSVDLMLTDTTAPPPPGEPLPPAPKIAFLQAHYCGTGTPRTVEVTNLPLPPATWNATIDGLATAMPGAYISFTPSALGVGTHTLQVIFTDSVGADTSSWTFEVDSVHAPVVTLHASPGTVDPSMSEVELTTTETGGGDMPIFEFAKDSLFTTISIFAHASRFGVTSVEVSTLPPGSNTFYVRMWTSDSCTTAPTVIGSTVVTLDVPAIDRRMIDPDNPGQAIIAGPNPVNGRLDIYGLMSSKSYSINLLEGNGQQLVQRQVVGQTHTFINLDPRQTGLYFLRIYDVRKGRVIGVVKLLVMGKGH